MAGVTRRGVLAGLAAAGAGPGSSRAVARAAAESMPLSEHAARAGFIYGAAITVEGLGDPICRPLYESETQLVTTDLEFKFWSLRPTPETWDFSGADTIVSWARSKNKLVRAHTLIWNESNPDWLKRCSAREIERIFDEHIERVVSRYAGRIYVWDVINEPCWPDHGKPRGLRQGPWYNALGADYIPRALKRVRALDPHARLCINEGGCEETTGWGAQIRPAFERLIVDLRQQDVPLDVVGLQAHLRPDKPYDDARYVEFLHRIAATGVDIHITEFDVYDGSFPDGIVTRDRLVAERAAAYLKAALSVPAVKMVVNWELVDSSSFYVREELARNPGALRLPRPLPFDSVGRRKPLWYAMASAFDARSA